MTKMDPRDERGRKHGEYEVGPEEVNDSEAKEIEFLDSLHRKGNRNTAKLPLGFAGLNTGKDLNAVMEHSGGKTHIAKVPERRWRFAPITDPESRRRIRSSQ